jgi:putative ABC transport system ATP-binding protein
MTEPDIMVRLDGLGMRYPMGTDEILVLEDLTLAIAAGERVAVVGPSGCGKTTLLLLLAGLEQPTAGTVTLNGHSLRRMDRDALADLRRDHLGIVFQAFHLVPSLSALDNVALPLEIAGTTGARERAAQMLGAVGLAARAAHLPAQLSGGEQQRVAIARALVHAPALLLADEPTGNLDEHTGAQVADLLFDLVARAGTTLVLVTHDPNLAARCDRVLRLHDGRLCAPDTARAGDAMGRTAGDR